MVANDDVTAADRRRLESAGEKYGKVTKAWRVTADDRPAVVGVCSRAAILLTDDDTIRLAYTKVGTRVTASGATRTLESAGTSTSIEFGDAATAEEFGVAWSGTGAHTTAPRSWRGELAFLSGLLLFLAAVVLVAGVWDAAVLFAHSRKGVVPDGFGGEEVGRVHPQTAVGFAVLLGSVVSAAVLAWCGVVGHYVLQRLEPVPPESKRETT